MNSVNPTRTTRDWDWHTRFPSNMTDRTFVLWFGIVGYRILTDTTTRIAVVWDGGHALERHHEDRTGLWLGRWHTINHATGRTDYIDARLARKRGID